MMAGIPDIIGCYRGRFIGWEVKREAGIPAKPIQLFYLKRIRAAGGVAALIHSVEQARTILDRLDEKSPSNVITPR